MSAFNEAWAVLKEERCLECGGIIPDTLSDGTLTNPSDGPYETNKLCDCEFPF
tara:strand:- start:275 stop:433 length:159 start_codon:yes stop_codon:yes gene_type:complete